MDTGRLGSLEVSELGGCEDCLRIGDKWLHLGEDWSWCYIDEVGMLLPEMEGTTSIPPSPLGTNVW